MKPFFADTGEQRIPDVMHERDVGHRQHAGPFDESEPLVIDQPVAEMLDPVAVIVAGVVLKRLLERLQRHIHGHIADGMDTDPVARVVIGGDGLVQFVLLDTDQPFVAGDHPHRVRRTWPHVR